VHERVKGSTLTSLPGLGHLMHEEMPELIAHQVLRLMLAKG
jgi:pimeloyl-ACP methyl ester carboxylesterase